MTMAPGRTNSPDALQIRGTLLSQYPDVYTEAALAAIRVLAPFNERRLALMHQRMQRRAERFAKKQPITFLDPATTIPGTRIRVQDARDGAFEGSEIPADLRRQWIQGTGPAARPNSTVETNLRNVAYALL